MNKVLFILFLSVISAQQIDNRYHSTQEIYSYLDSLDNIEELNDWLMIDTIGFSSQENIPIIAIKISDNANIKEDEPRLLFVGQVHAEEILGVEIVLDLINDLLFPDPSIVTHMNILKEYLDIWIIPTLNPEGLNVIHEGYDLSYRKNKRDLSPDGPYPNSIFDFDPSIGNDIDGVDLNRNFGFNWAFGDTFLEPDNSDYASHYDYYKGEHPFSESESIALRNLALENDFVFSIVWHSSRSGNLSEKVFTSWKWEEVKESPDLNIMKKISDHFSGLIPTEDGTSTYLSVYSGSRNGKIHDWFYKTTGSFQYLVECGTANLQPDSVLIENTIDRTKPAMIYLMDRTIGYYADASQITGIIYDSETNQPVEGAFVEVLEHTGSVLSPRKTNEFGRYRRILDVGTYTLSIMAEGYNDKQVISVANNSGITYNDIFIDPSQKFNLEINIMDNVYNISSLEAILKTDFGITTIELSAGAGNLFELPSDEYQIIIPMNEGDNFVPWEKTIVLNRNTSLNIPIIESENVIIDNPWTWETVEGDWVFHNGVLSSQSDHYYSNIDSLACNQIIESNFINVADNNKILFHLNHKYETEWDHDFINIQIVDSYDNILLNQKISGSTNNNFVDDYFTIINDSTFSQIKIRLRFLIDNSVNYEGWDIAAAKLFLVQDDFLSILNHSSNKIPSIPLKINTISPNPSNGRLQIDLNQNFSGTEQLKIFNILGQEVFSKKINMKPGSKNFVLDLQHNNDIKYGSGMYFIQIESNNKRAIKKCVILKN